MKKFSQIVNEDRKNDSTSLLQSEITSFISKVKKQMTPSIAKIVHLTQKYNLNSKDQLEEFRNATAGDISTLVDKYNIPTAEVRDLVSLLKSVKKDIRMLPQYMSDSERKSVEMGKLALDDMTIDLTSTAGRNAAAKMMTPVVLKIVSQYIGKSRLGKNELLSAGMMGLANACNDWKSEPEDDEAVVPFRTYVSYRVKQQILNDINKYSHDLSTSIYGSQTYGGAMLDAISLDGLPKDSDGDFKQDRLSALGVTDGLTKDEEKTWNALIKLLNDKFTQRDCDIFYRYFGINGMDRMKSKDIAKMYGMSEGNIRNSIINKMLTWLRTNPKAVDAIEDIKDLYTEALMKDMIGLNQEQILEQLASNDTYILLESMTRWSSKTVFEKTLNVALKVLNKKQSDLIKDILSGDFESIDSNLKKEHATIILFLSHMYPTETFANLTDVDILEYMAEIQNSYKKFVK